MQDLIAKTPQFCPDFRQLQGLPVYSFWSGKGRKIAARKAFRESRIGPIVS